MGLSIADVDQWNPDSLNAVGAASTARANAAAEANSALRGLSAFDSWQGTGADAARVRTQAYADNLDGVVPPRSWRVPYAASGVMLDSLIS